MKKFILTERFVLTGPQGIGKTRCAERIAAALNLNGIADGWNGSDDFPNNSLAITNVPRDELICDASAVVLIAEDRKALLDLVTALERAAASIEPAV